MSETFVSQKICAHLIGIFRLQAPTGGDHFDFRSKFLALDHSACERARHLHTQLT